MEVYVIESIRYGVRDLQCGILGVESSFKKASFIGKWYRVYRAGKYEQEIVKFTVPDKTKSVYVVKLFEKEDNYEKTAQLILGVYLSSDEANREAKAAVSRGVRSHSEVVFFPVGIDLESKDMLEMHYHLGSLSEVEMEYLRDWYEDYVREVKVLI